MPENSSTFSLARCPKCGHLLPEIPSNSVYNCDGCDAFPRAEKGSSVDDALSEKSWEERNGEGPEREGNGEIVGIDRGGGNERSAATSKVSKSPVRSRCEETIRKSPIRESTSGDLDVVRKSPTRGNVLGEFDEQSKSSGRSMDGDLRKFPLRESTSGGLDVRGKSPARSVQGGLRKSPLRESVLRDFDEQRSTERDVVANSAEMEAREKVGAWFNQVEEEVEYADRLVTQKGSFNEWLSYGSSFDESELNRLRVSPRRRTWSLDESPTGSGLNPRGKRVGRRTDQIVDETHSKYNGLYGRRPVEVPHDDWVLGGDHGLPRRHRDLRVQDGYVGQFGSPTDEMEQWGAQRNEFGHVHGINRAARVGQRFPVYPNAGPSSYGPYYGYESSSGSSSLRTVDMNRAELFRMYNELKEQLSRTGDLPENPTRRGDQRTFSANCYVGPDDSVHETLRLRRSVASVDLEERARMEPHYMNSSWVSGPFVNDRNMDDVSSFPPSKFGPHEFPFDDDPSWPLILRRTHHRPKYYPQRSAHDYIPQYSMDSTCDPSGLNPLRKDLHHTHGNPNNLLMQASAAFGYRRYQNYQTDSVSDSSDPYGQCTSGPRFPYSAPGNLSSHSGSSIDRKSDGDGSAREHGKWVAVVPQNQLLCHPIAGAAPFVLCSYCSELLRLPKKLNTMKQAQFRLQCGSCRTTLSFDFGKKSHASMQLQPEPTSTDVHDVPSEMYESEHKSALESSAGITEPEPYDFDATVCTFPSTNSEPSVKLEDRRLNSGEAKKKQGLCPSSSNVSKYDHDLDNAVTKTDASDNFAPNKSDEKETEGSGLNHVQNTNQPTELEINQPIELEIKSDEIPKADISHSSEEAFSKNDKGGYKEADVSVNGQPLPHRVVRMAEKLAGPISPGKYWYDSTAGFWGVMGNCCLGIIPPFIQEFGFPMPANCADGNTGIYVNGRELHEKDLELLARRGLPRIRNKCYVVDISGKVQDESTNDLVVDLGKLAPTVEKAKHGFGMQPFET